MKVLFLDTVHPILEQRLTRSGMTCVDATSTPTHAAIQANSDAQGLVLRGRIQVDSTVLHALPELRFICRSGAGLENIDLTATESKGIRVYNSPEGNRDAVGEHALGLLLSLLHKLRQGDQSMRKGQWDREGHRGAELKTRTVGIIGYGHMGSAFAEKLLGLGCPIIAHDPHRDDVDGALDGRVRAVDLDTFRKEADVVSLHCNLTPETRGMVDRDFLSAFHKPIVLLNTARGPILKTEDLMQALDEGDVLVAGLDVFDKEASTFEKVDAQNDPIWDRLLAHPNIQVSPHVAGWTQESYVKLSSFLADKVLADFS